MELQTQLLKSFLTQFDSTEATSAHEDGDYAVEFLKLKRQSTKYRTEKTYSSKVADRQENVKKNRYKDIVPFDHSRVKLSLNTSKNDADYINANFIRGVFGPTEYIATQGPLPHTVLDFWRMLWEYNVQVIIMACREFEMGRKKCERYWPATTVDVFVCEPFTIKCESEENKGDFLIRILKVTFKNSSRTLKQLHYMNWPDHGIPDSIPPILDMLQDMRVFQERDDVPICIHCSAGCGRTGVLCAIDYTWNLLKKQIIPEDFNIYDLVQDMRKQRPSMVQTKEQYELVYRAITFLFKNHLQMMESSSKQKEVPAEPPPIPEDTDSEFSDFSESEGETSNPTPNQERGNEHQKSQTTEPPPSHSTALGYRNSQILKPTLVKPTDFGLRKSQILQPPLVQPTDLACRNSQILEPPPVKPTDFVFRKAQIPKPPRMQKTDLGCRMSQTIEPPPVQETDLGYQKSQIIEHPLLKQKDIECQKSHIAEPPPIQPNIFGYLKFQISKPLRHQKADLGFHKPQIPEIATTTQTQNNDTLKSNNHIRPAPVQVFSPHQMHQTEMNIAGASLQTPSICLTVEDPYFAPDSPMPTGSTENTEAIPHFMENPCYIGPTSILKTLNIKLQDKHTGVITSISDDDSSPPLPERTPESYIMADEGLPQILTPTLKLVTVESPLLNASDMGDIDDRSDNMGDMANIGVDQSLTLVIPPGSFSITGAGESHPSPVPPLPERTPESFEMANNKDILQNAVQEKPQETVLRVGKSSEWSGNSTLDVPDFKRSWSRSKSLNARLSLNVPVNIQSFAPLHIPSPEPCKSRTPSLPERSPDSFLMDASVTQAYSSFTPPLPRRTPESFIVVTEEDQRNSAPCRGEPTQQRLGTSSEWAGNSQFTALPDLMTRSKSVKVKSSKQECLSVVSLPDPHAGASAEPALSRDQHQRSLDCRSPAMEQSEIRSLTKKCRTKSLKLWKGRQKTKEAPVSAAVPPNHGASAGFIFTAFGTRFGKPKGPRGQPETWV